MTMQSIKSIFFFPNFVDIGFVNTNVSNIPAIESIAGKEENPLNSNFPINFKILTLTDTNCRRLVFRQLEVEVIVVSPFPIPENFDDQVGRPQHSTIAKYHQVDQRT